MNDQTLDDRQYSINDLDEIFCRNPGSHLNFRMAFLCNSYEDFISIIDDAVSLIIRDMEANPQHYAAMDEDAITNSIIVNLKYCGLDAHHDSMQGGHTDIMITGKKGYTWIAEAKIHKGYDWLFKGFQQLDTRYAAPAAGRDCAALVIYSDNMRVDQLLENWKNHLKDKRPEVELFPTDEDSLQFISTHNHIRNNRKITIRHFVASLYFNPKDK